uniref:Protein yippee-like n=1 Tax=Chlamydomonas euryale TaxID=1486919 RepID=A0A7R9VRM0_9CHLO|mmetsp:Transcript_42532/g.127559  ORF Transcript_42532/g.127559 Transcript_42532/m.127559 type:complete len:128 (+) Transcript_42532:227-610(+)
MGRPFYEHLGDGHVYSCAVCRVPIVRKEALLSKAFHARSGKAYLFHHAANVFTGPQEERMMTTGMHLVSDIFCVSCCSLIGWRYDFAYEKSQKYKEDKVILERSMVVRTYHGDDAPCELDSDASDDY